MTILPLGARASSRDGLTSSHDWLKTRPFRFCGAVSGLLCCSPRATWPWAAGTAGGTTFATSWYTHGIASSYWKRNFLTAAVQQPGRVAYGQQPDCCSAGAQGRFVQLVQAGWPLAIRGAAPALSRLIGFMLRSVLDCSPGGIPPPFTYRRIAFSGPDSLVFVSVFLIYPLRFRSSWFFARASVLGGRSSVSCCSLQGFHNCDLNPYPHDGRGRDSGRALLCPSTAPGWRTRCLRIPDQSMTPSRRLRPTQESRHYAM